MKSKNIARLIFLVLGLTFASVSLAKSPVFKVSKGDDHVFIGGTIHLLSENDYPLPSAFYKAFETADHVYFETDTGQVSSPEVQVKMARVMGLPEEQTLETLLNEETYARFQAYLNERQLPISTFQKITPSAVSIALTVFELQRLNLGDPANGVDQFFISKANEAGKKLFYLESLEEQIGFLDTLNDIDPNVVFNSNLDDLSNLGENWEKALSAWREGNIEVMGDILGGEKLRTEFPEVHKVLLTDRNNRWLTQIKTMLDTKEIELILVGALHLANDEGLIEQLRKGGYGVEQLD